MAQINRLTRSQTAGDLINLMNEARMRWETISLFITTCMGWIFFLQCHVIPLVVIYWSNPLSVILVLLYFPTFCLCRWSYFWFVTFKHDLKLNVEWHWGVLAQCCPERYDTPLHSSSTMVEWWRQIAVLWYFDILNA